MNSLFNVRIYTNVSILNFLSVNIEFIGHLLEKYQNILVRVVIEFDKFADWFMLMNNFFLYCLILLGIFFIIILDLWGV